MNLDQIERETLANGKREIKQLYKHQLKEQAEAESAIILDVERN